MQEFIPTTLNDTLRCGVVVWKVCVFCTANPIPMDKDCVHQGESFACVQQTLGWSLDVHVDTNSEVKLVGGLWPESDAGVIVATVISMSVAVTVSS